MICNIESYTEAVESYTVKASSKTTVCSKDYYFLCIPVFMVLHFLEFWCSKHIDKNAFTSSSVLVHHDLEMYADDDIKASLGRSLEFVNI